jgi:hypothetical protein
MVKTIQNICKAKLCLPSSKMAKKPLLTDRMKLQRLYFARQYENWGWRSGRRLCFWMKATLSSGLVSGPGTAGGWWGQAGRRSGSL